MFIQPSQASVCVHPTLTSIGEYAFFQCKCLESIKLPASLTAIGLKAFHNCSSLTTLTILSDFAAPRVLTSERPFGTNAVRHALGLEKVASDVDPEESESEESELQAETSDSKESATEASESNIEGAVDHPSAAPPVGPSRQLAANSTLNPNALPFVPASGSALV